MQNVQSRFLQFPSRLHPLVGPAATVLIVASAVAIAAVGGYLPGSKAEQAAEPSWPVLAAACTECGVVLGVKEESVMGKGTGIGAVAGGIAGHQLERSARSTKKYNVSLRMQDGSVTVVSLDSRPAWRSGDKVRLHNGVMKPFR